MTPELDERYSDTGTVALPWEAARRVLEESQLAWISTVHPDGRPHVTPLVPVWLDEALYFATGPHEEKARNLAANPHVVLTTGCNTWNEGSDVMVEGEAVRVTDRATLERLTAAWATKWDGRWKFGVGDGVLTHDTGDRHAEAEPAYAFVLEPSKVLAFGKGRFTHTRYRPGPAR